MKKLEALNILNKIGPRPGTILDNAVNILIRRVNAIETDTEDLPPVVEQRINEAAASKKK